LRILVSDRAVVPHIANRIGCIKTLGIIKIIGIARRIGIFVDVKLRHCGFFTVSPAVEEWFLANYVQ